MEYTRNHIEEWRDAPGYDGFYQVSSVGRVRSWKKYRSNRRKKPRLLKPDLNTWGYKYVILYKNQKGNHELIHRLVAKAFIENPLNKLQVNHIDGDRENNCVENLEWVTNKENSAHAHELGLIDNRGVKNGQSKLTREDVLDIRNAYRLGCFSYRDFEGAYGISNSCVSMIINEKRWRHL